MKLHLAAWILGSSIVGVILWISSSSEYSLDELASKALISEHDRENSEMADRDSAAEEVRAVATKITNLEQAMENQDLESRKERDAFISEIEEKYEKIRNAIEKSRQPATDTQLTATVDHLSSRIQQLEQREEIREEETDFVRSHDSELVWYFSTDLEQSFIEDNLGDISISDNSPPTNSPSSPPPETNPHYTIPPTTTLLGATALTALVGRIPVQGKIQDPWRYKIIVGPDNLAANGHRIPQLAGMIWVGTARGDLALSCVSGNLDTATFIFFDGSIQTARNRAESSNSKGGLGWISDEFGNPCIAGELKSNALQYLTQSTLIDTTKASADALANAQTESRFDPKSGETNTAVVGDIDKFVASYAVKESLDEISQWLKDRQLSSFDAIYVPAGKKVAIHVEEPILIDHEPNGRKVIQPGYEVPTSNARNGWID
ncbi:MAG: TIGR03752 family integrating conjugative element protein [Acidiferrobacterales bacterium]|nr:TIGR03752 family integrating conjugative element protein [Acidiferrobacterales bacterium]